MIIPGQGTLLQYESATPGTFVTVGHRVTIGGLPLKNNEKNRTELDDTVVKTAKSIADGGELSFQIHHDPSDTSHAHLLALFGSGDEVNWKLVLNDATVIANRSTYAFAGWVSGFNPSGFEVESDVVADGTIRLTTIPTLTPRS